jgi:hypothetical protein
MDPFDKVTLYGIVALFGGFALIILAFGIAAALVGWATC